VSLAAAPYRASGLVRWRLAEVEWFARGRPLLDAPDGRVGEVGDDLRRDASLTDVKLLLELPDHVPGGGNAGRGRGTRAKQPHQIFAALRKAAREIVRSNSGIARIGWHTTILVSGDQLCDSLRPSAIRPDSSRATNVSGNGLDSSLYMVIRNFKTAARVSLSEARTRSAKDDMEILDD
jgi:hypothetical protein